MLMKRIAAILSVLMMACGAACAGAEAATEIVFWHCMTETAGDALDALVAEFNATVGAEKGIHVSTVYQGAYTDAVAKMNSMLSAGDSGSLPDVMQLDATGKVVYGAADTAYTVQERLEEYQDISDAACIREYYSQLYAFYDEAIKRNSIAAHCSRIDNLPFATYARNFNMIDSNTVAVAVAGDAQSEAMIEQLKSDGYTNYRKLQKYTFTLYEPELEDLLRQGAVKEYGGIFCLINPDYYSKETGVCFQAADYYI